MNTSISVSVFIGMFILNKEDHTLGNLLRLQLLRNPDVRFSGYRIPHPLVHYVELKIQTSSGNVTPTEVLSAAIEDLSNEFDFLESAAAEAIEKWKNTHGTNL